MKDLILGIESSCDDTGIALVKENGSIIASEKVTQEHIHQQYGGVYPEMASRAHVAAIIPALDKVMKNNNIDKNKIRAIGVTRGPGLICSLLVGINTATGIGIGWGIPVIGINHLRGHLRSAALENAEIKYPATILLVSGGHTILAYMKDSININLLGVSQDDSVGEAYDKVARMMGLGYPGGPLIDNLAPNGKPNIPFPRPMLNKGLDFSLSGLKSAVYRYIISHDEYSKEDVAASFVQAILDVLLTKAQCALKQNKSEALIIVGGVAASPQLRSAAKDLCIKENIELCLPPLRWATDNAAMIALATWDYIREGIKTDTQPIVRLPITEF